MTNANGSSQAAAQTASANGPNSDLPNWKNVNNWHWVEKNCIEWARKWLSNNLKTISGVHVNDYADICVSSVSDIEGDVDLNVRKGKLRYLYDLSLKLTVEGTFLLISFLPH